MSIEVAEALSCVCCVLIAMASTTLRAVTHRLTTTPVDQLPSIAAFLAASLSDCAELLSAPQAQKPGKGDSDHAVQIHKLKTRLASLLQDRSVEGRWTAVVLVKATVEAGQWEILRGYEPIVRGLIGILAVRSSLRAYCTWQLRSCRLNLLMGLSRNPTLYPPERCVLSP